MHRMIVFILTGLLFTRLDVQRFRIVTLSPVALDVAGFLSAAIDSLRQSVGLQGISLAVPVTAVLMLARR